MGSYYRRKVFFFFLREGSRNNLLLDIVKIGVYANSWLSRLNVVSVTDETSALDCASFDGFPEAMMTSHLTAMKNGSVEARQRFPRLLQIVDYYPETIPTFRTKVACLICFSLAHFLTILTLLSVLRLSICPSNGDPLLFPMIMEPA